MSLLKIKLKYVATLASVPASAEVSEEISAKFWGNRLKLLILSITVIVIHGSVLINLSLKREGENTAQKELF